MTGGQTMPELKCFFCHKPCDPTDHDNWFRVTVWVHGPKRNGACMQDDEILAVAHGGCARLTKMGVGIDQQPMFA
jgi:hypothetical protein